MNQTMHSNQQAQARKSEWVEKATKLKEVALDTLESLPEEKRATAPKPGEWSAAQVVEHLILVEENVAGMWRQKLLEMPSATTTGKSSMVSSMVSFVFSKTGMRVPTVPELEPKEAAAISKLSDRWTAARENLLAALPDDHQKAWVFHPVFGPLNSDQMGKLLASHLEYHLRHWPAPRV